jgi:hypothetical protein
VTNPIYVVVINYESNHVRFWNGKRPVAEYPDAEEYKTFNKGCIAYNRASVKLKDQAIDLVENYGLATERIALR